MKSYPASPLPPPPADTLVERLRADAGTPGFSPLLHQRVMTTLRARGGLSACSDALPAMEQPVRSRWVLAARIGLPAAAAAALTLMVWLNMQPASKPLGHPDLDVPVVELPSVPTDFFPTQPAIVPQALESAKFANLDKDAQRLAVFVADQFPSLNFPADH